MSESSSTTLDDIPTVCGSAHLPLNHTGSLLRENYGGPHPASLTAAGLFTPCVLSCSTVYHPGDLSLMSSTLAATKPFIFLSRGPHSLFPIIQSCISKLLVSLQLLTPVEIAAPTVPTRAWLHDVWLWQEVKHTREYDSARMPDFVMWTD